MEIERLLKKSLILTLGFVLATAVILTLFHKFSWAAGFLVGNLWSAANFLFMVNLFKLIVSKENKIKVIIMLLVKFPVLYLAGFLLFTYKIFPPLSLLAGLIPFLLITGIIKNVRTASSNSSS